MPPIASYEYARTRFLVLSDMFPDKHVPLGYRLLVKLPSDKSVKYKLVYLIYGRDASEAKRLSAELERAYPGLPAIIAQRGDVFDVAYGQTKSKNDLQQAVKYYELYLTKAPSSEPYRKIVELRLKRIRRQLAGGT